MTALAVLLIVLGCGAYQYLKGSIFQAVTTIIATILASAVAFGFFEMAADYFISKGSDSKVVPYAQSLCFVLLFVIAFAVLQTAVMQLAKQKVDFGVLPERVGRPILGAFMGLLVSGLLLTALAMAPLPNNYPYQRFDARNPNSESPSKVFLNVDGFVAGWFSMLSKGSLSAIRNPQGFGTVHADFLDQVYLNRHNDSDDISLVVKPGSVRIPSENGAWQAPRGGIKDSAGQAVTPQTGHEIIVVRMEMLRNAVSKTGKFTLGQLRLICKPRDSSGQEGMNIYPIGYFSGANEITTKRLSEKITLERSHFSDVETTKPLDFAFSIPNDYTPVALAFKQNCIMQVPRIVPADQAPPVSPFVERSQAAPGTTTPDEDAAGETFTPPSLNQGSDSPKDPKLSPPTRGLVPQLELNE
ncbi:MAG: CvpA family protein [Sedimentisphaerales bacterium]|nr:CvpA family protein [Sedimentisphaerales bacterium]